MKELKLKRTSWYELWKNYIFKEVYEERLELFQCPLANIFMLSSEDDVINALKALMYFHLHYLEKRIKKFIVEFHH